MFLCCQQGTFWNHRSSRHLLCYPTNIGDLSNASEVSLRYLEVKVLLYSQLCPIPTSAFYLPVWRGGEETDTYLDAASSIPLQYSSGSIRSSNTCSLWKKDGLILSPTLISCVHPSGEDDRRSVGEPKFFGDGVLAQVDEMWWEREKGGRKRWEGGKS